MAGIRFERLPVDSLCIRQPPRPVVAEARFEPGFDVQLVARFASARTFVGRSAITHGSSGNSRRYRPGAADRRAEKPDR